ncbi:hypothetical protein HJC23_011023 [Cyclotella cryptica]|uniref:Uncharacterized protein n=1 Tax=Cyclotella cryptica TaxID=29204 RepID=A0ABD3PEX8_9STRA
MTCQAEERSTLLWGKRNSFDRDIPPQRGQIYAIKSIKLKTDQPSFGEKASHLTEIFLLKEAKSTQ